MNFDGKFCADIEEKIAVLEESLAGHSQRLDKLRVAAEGVARQIQRHAGAIQALRELLEPQAERADDAAVTSEESDSPPETVESP